MVQMKNSPLPLTLSICLVFLFTPVSAPAELVSYIDDQGEMHYVNTSFSKVPEKYLSQIEEQLNPPAVENEAPAPQPDLKPETKTGDITQSLPAPDPVEVLISSDCTDCQRLLMLLTAHKIEFSTLDVNTNPRGQELYAETGGELPITKIGTETIPGLDTRTIASIYHAQRKKGKKTDNQTGTQTSVPENEPELNPEPPAGEIPDTDEEMLEEIEPETKVYEF